MDHASIVKKLCDRCGAEPSLAYDALERTDWDLLDAILTLEREGAIAPITASASTAARADGYGRVLPTASAGDARTKSKRRKKAK